MIVVFIEITVNVAAVDVILRRPSLTIARNRAPLSDDCVVKEYVAAVAPVILFHELPFNFCH